MSKTTLVMGWLCRDKRRPMIVVFFGGGLPELEKSGEWSPPARFAYQDDEWTAVEWRATYDLAPPKPGEKFLVEIQL